MINWCVAEEMINRRVPDKEIAKQLKCSWQSIKKHRLDMGIKAKGLDYDIMDLLIFLNYECENGDNIISEIMDCSEISVAKRRRWFGLKKRHREYASGRTGISYYPDVLDELEAEVRNEFNVEGNFKEWIQNHKTEVSEWNATKQMQ
jgi:hypothetical protein